MDKTQELKEIATAILELGLFLNITVTDAQLKLYALQIQRNITLQDFLYGRQIYLDKHLLDRPANEELYRTIARIIEIARPKARLEEEAQAIANKIIGGVNKHGYTNAASARADIGEVGWSVVSMRGGWVQHCQTLTAQNMASITAQIRDMVLAQLRSGGKAEFYQHTGPAISSKERVLLDMAKPKGIAG